MAADEIERFRREIVQRTGNLRDAENLTDQDLLREVMNTVGKNVFNGPAPILETFATPETESEAVAIWLKERLDDGIQPQEIGVFVRSEAQLPRAQSALKAAGIPYKILDSKMEVAFGHAALCTMHLAKGLEFRAVAVMACDDEVIPLQERIETVADNADFEEIYNTERHLLYVACTRARDYLLRLPRLCE